MDLLAACIIKYSTFEANKLTPKDDKAECKNYRPISVISNVAKIFDNLIYNQLLAFLNENEVHAENQSGFRSNHST
jgi:hypothetical protein